MSGADVFVAVVLSGIGLSAVYLVAEYIRWRKHEAAKRNRSADFRNLKAGRTLQAGR